MPKKSHGFYGYHEVLATRRTPQGEAELIGAIHTLSRQRVRGWRATGADVDPPWVPAQYGAQNEEIWPPSMTLLSVPHLKERGWTDALIKKFLGEGDGSAINPHYKTGPRMRLYLQDRVEALEQDPAVQQAFARAQRRREAVRDVVARRRTKLEQWVAALTISVPSLAPDELLSHACRHYKAAQHVPDWVLEREERSGYGRDATPDSDPAFLARITVNFLRHMMTNYEELLDQTFGKVGADDAREDITRKVYAAIAAQYPTLADECQRQLARRFLQDNA